MMHCKILARGWVALLSGVQVSCVIVCVQFSSQYRGFCCEEAKQGGPRQGTIGAFSQAQGSQSLAGVAPRARGEVGHCQRAGSFAETSV